MQTTTYNFVGPEDKIELLKTSSGFRIGDVVLFFDGTERGTEQIIELRGALEQLLDSGRLNAGETPAEYQMEVIAAEAAAQSESEEEEEVTELPDAEDSE